MVEKPGGAAVDPKTISDIEDKPVDDAGSPPVRKATKCQDLKATTERAIAALDRSCTSDEDCDSTGFGCPFGCRVPIRKGAKVSHVVPKAARYHDMCGRCKYRCRFGEVRCVKKRCTDVLLDDSKPDVAGQPP